MTSAAAIAVTYLRQWVEKQGRFRILPRNRQTVQAPEIHQPGGNRPRATHGIGRAEHVVLHPLVSICCQNALICMSQNMKSVCIQCKYTNIPYNWGQIHLVHQVPGV